MLQRKQAINLQINQLLDAGLLGVALWVAHALRYYGTVYFDLETRIPPFRDFVWLVALIVPFGPLLLEMQGFYEVSLAKPLWRSITQILRAAVWYFVLVGVAVIFLKLTLPSRSVLILFGILATVLLLVRERLMMARRKRRASGTDFRDRVLLVGSSEETEALAASFNDEANTEMAVLARIDIETQPMSDLVAAMHLHSASRVIFAGGHGHIDKIQQGISCCEAEGVEACLVADFICTSIARPTLSVLSGRPMLVFRNAPEFSWELFVKALIDRVGAAIGLLLLSPLILGTAIGIALTSKGPIFFHQLRGGRHGKPFTMYKFRTMVTNAEMLRDELIAFNQMSGPVFKIDKDPRVTPFGHWLRRTSVDELPQLLNVLLGDMSLVGPRPLPLYEVEKFEESSHRRRLSVKPGLTCLWQISGRNKVSSFTDWVNLDLKYIDNWSLWLDLKILVLTVPVVLFGKGAH